MFWLVGWIFFFKGSRGGEMSWWGRVRVELVGKSLAVGTGSVSDDLDHEQTVCGWCQLCILTCPNSQ